MPHDYTLTKFLRQTPKPLLAEYFSRRGLLPDVDFAALRKTQVEPIIEALEQLAEDARGTVESDFQAVFSLADRAGTQIVVDQAALRGLAIADEIEAMENHYHRAMWLLLHHGPPDSDLFEDCVTIARFDDMSFTAARRRKDLPLDVPASDGDTLAAMADAISAVYRPQGRGYRCQVEHFLRPNPTRHCFYGYPEDYTTSELQFEGPTLSRRLRKSVFEVALVFRPDEGILEISAPGAKKDIQALQEVFCRYALGMDRLPPPTNHRCYELNGLKQRSFAFPTDPADGIAKVEVAALRLHLNGRPRQRVAVEHDPATGITCHDWMDNVLDQRQVPLKMLDVAQVRIRVEWVPDNGGKARRPFTFTVGMPDSSSLRDEPHHLLLKRYLAPWKIAP